MKQQFRLLGWLLSVLGLFAFLSIVIASAVYLRATMAAQSMLTVIPQFGGLLGGVLVPDHRPSVFSVLATMWPSAMAVAAVAFAQLLQMVSGVLLLRCHRFSRVSTIVVSACLLPGFPFWTSLGIYGLWIMCSSEGKRAWEQYVSGSVSQSTNAGV